jgi:uncharacterized protein
MGEQEKGKQGFASINEDTQKEIASKGGKTAHEFSADEEKEAGKKGVKS